MLSLYRFLCGILEVEFFGVYPEKVLNLCSKNGINIWSSRYLKQKIRCKMTVKSFLKLPLILQKSGIRVHILKKSGFPFFMRRYNRRIGLFLGVVMFFVFLQIMSGFIWIIDIEGNEKVNDNEIYSSLGEMGIIEGIKKSKIASKNDAQELLLKMDKLAWASLNIEGCKLTVNVTEITQKTQDNSVATNLISTSDGTITHIDITMGNCLVKVGDVVKKGDVLVSGIIENLSGTKFVHSSGEIMAKTETEIVLQEKLTQEVLLSSGKRKTKKVLSFFGIKIPLYLGGERGNFETKVSKKQLKLFSQNLPIKIYKKCFDFKDKKTVNLTEEEATAILEKRLEKEYFGEVRDKNIYKNDNAVYLKAVIVENKNIAKSENLIFSVEN